MRNGGRLAGPQVGRRPQTGMNWASGRRQVLHAGPGTWLFPLSAPRPVLGTRFKEDADKLERAQQRATKCFEV